MTTAAMKQGLFHHALMKALSDNWNHHHQDNYDRFRFGDEEKEIVDGQASLSAIERYLDEFAAFFSLLEDDRSRELLVRVLAFRILGHRKVRLPLSRPEFWNAIRDMAPLFDEGVKMETRLLGSAKELHFADLAPLGFPIRLYTMPRTVIGQFVLKQYVYVKDDRSMIGARPGGVVIDGGACWGDTALCFAHTVQEHGKVYAFEFIPGNLNVARENFRLNPGLAKTLRIVERPLWDESGIRMYYSDNGPGSRVSFDPMAGGAGQVETVSIDDFVEQECPGKVDLIKMDIEGAEQPALRGAERTLRRYRPDLAISIYHSMDDFAHVVHLINGLDLGYRFYLDHFTIHYEETVLYAQA